MKYDTDSTSMFAQRIDLVHIIGAFIERMRNEEVAKTMRATKESFKQHTDGQKAKYTQLLEHYIATMNLPLPS